MTGNNFQTNFVLWSFLEVQKYLQAQYLLLSAHTYGLLKQRCTCEADSVPEKMMRCITILSPFFS